MYLYGENQFDTAWEYAYHDLLTVGRKWTGPNDRVLILGSGDLMNHRFLGNHDVVLIDIDPHMTDLAQSNELMLRLNKFQPSPNYRIYNGDALDYLEQDPEMIREFKYVVIDFPVMISPVNDGVKKFSLERFFSREVFIDVLIRNLSHDALITMQADDNLHHTEHMHYFTDLIIDSGSYYHSYSIWFPEIDMRQYFYMFTKNKDIYEYFQENIGEVTADPGLFRKDEYFTELFNSWQNGEISYAQYRDCL